MFAQQLMARWRAHPAPFSPHAGTLPLWTWVWRDGDCRGTSRSPIRSAAPPAAMVTVMFTATGVQNAATIRGDGRRRFNHSGDAYGLKSGPVDRSRSRHRHRLFATNVPDVPGKRSAIRRPKNRSPIRVASAPRRQSDDRRPTFVTHLRCSMTGERYEARPAARPVASRPAVAGALRG